MSVDTGIGTTLREARNRRKVDLSKVEAATKIRIRYLRAMENEEWDALPGGAYTRGFIRTYASYLGLDGERLAEEYRRDTAPPGGERAPRVEPAATGIGTRRRPWLSSRAVAVAVVAALVAALVAIGLASGGDDSPPTGAGDAGTGAQRKEGARATTGAALAPRGAVAIQLTAEAEVWVCLLDAEEQALIEGRILEAGAEEGPFRSERFMVSFGNGEVSLLVDGEAAEIPATSSPIGYEIEAGGELTPLEEGERPTCT